MKNLLAPAFISLLMIYCPINVSAQKAPAPYGALPSARQLQIQEMEMYALMHFTPTTYQNKEWGFGDADPSIFDPSDFNANEIINAIKEGGFKGITVVAKHHDGFCLWPTKTTEYNISQSPFRNGKGDLVKEMMLASHKEGLGFGLYCSPWDRNNKYYGTPDYINNVYYPQLKELYANYGKLFTVFYDGANGGDGYYGGTNEKRKIDASAYYNFDTIWSMVRSMQPTANIFSDIGPDIRWVGNEKGIAAETSWATFTPRSPEAGKKPAPGFVIDAELPGGTRNGKYWIPAECDVPLRPGWFYHPDQDDKVKTPRQLLDLYYQSVGRGATLDLGIAPMPSGRLHQNDISNLKKFGSLLKHTFEVNFAKGAVVTGSNTRGQSQKFSANQLIDNDRYSYWATDDSVTTPEVIFQLKNKAEFNVVRIRENIKLGQRIEEVAIDIWKNNKWETIGKATSIGGNRLIRLPNYVSTGKVRLRVLKSPVCVAISDFGLFKEPEEAMGISSNQHKAESHLRDSWKILPESAKEIIDGNNATFWTATVAGTTVVWVDMGEVKNIKAFTYLPRQDNNKKGIITQYNFYLSSDNVTWKKVAEGEFANIANNPLMQTIKLPYADKARYFRFEAKSTFDGSPATIAELGVEAD